MGMLYMVWTSGAYFLLVSNCPIANPTIKASEGSRKDYKRSMTTAMVSRGS
jgi:hypothetical protein